MANYFPAQTKVSPSFSEPGLIVTYAQPSGAFALLDDGKPKVKIGSEDLYVYINRLDLRSETQVSQSAGNLLPSASLVADYYQTQTYLIRTRTTYDHHDMAAAAQYDVSLPAAQNLAMRQGIFQQMRNGLLYGFNASNGEGLLNTVGATAVTLPPDSYGNTTAQTYDNGQMAEWLLGEMTALRNGMFLSGIPMRVVFTGPQRILSYMEMQQIVQITSYQRAGGGSKTVVGTMKDIAGGANVEFEWTYDDTLEGKGSGGADMVVLAVPKIDTPSIPGINTNEFGAEIQPKINAVNIMYADMAAPMKIPTPVPDGGITEVQELRITSGWCIRPQGLYLLSIPY